MVSSDLAVGAASLLATAASSEPSSLRRLAGLAVQQVNGCAAATAALWRDGEPGRGDVEPPRAARADLGPAPHRPRADRGRAGQRGPGQLRRHADRRAVAGVLRGRPRAGDTVLAHAALPRRPGLLHPVPVRGAAGGDGPGPDPAGRAAGGVRRRGPGRRVRLRRGAAHGGPVARRRGRPVPGQPGQGHPDARARLQRRRGPGPDAPGLAAQQHADHGGGRHDHWCPGRPAGAATPAASQRAPSEASPSEASRRAASRSQPSRREASPAVSDVPDRQPPGDGVAELRARHEALQQTATMPGADLRPLLDAALAELDGAIDALGAAQAQPAGPARKSARRAPCTPSGACCTRCSSRCRCRCSCSARTAPCAGPTRRRARCSGRPAATRPGSRSARW